MSHQVQHRNIMTEEMRNHPDHDQDQGRLAEKGIGDLQKREVVIRGPVKEMKTATLLLLPDVMACHNLAGRNLLRDLELRIHHQDHQANPQVRMKGLVHQPLLHEQKMRKKQKFGQNRSLMPSMPKSSKQK